MAKSTGEKQEVTNRRFDLGNVKKAKNGKGEDKKEPKKKKIERVPIKFKVHKNRIKEFHDLRMDYAKKNERFSLSNNEFFNILVGFMKSEFEKENILKVCPEDFKEAVIRPGKRKATERTFPKKETDSILFTIPEYVADEYMDLMFSFIVKDPKGNIFDEHHTRTYFFYDFLEFMVKSKKDLLKFNMENE